MIFCGIFFCLIAIFVLYQRINFILFGKKTSGTIIGFTNYTKGTKGFDTYNYKVEYEYQNHKYVSTSLENVTVPRNAIPNKNLFSDIFLYFKPKKPELVTIVDFKQTTILGSILFLLGFAFIVLHFLLML